MRMPLIIIAAMTKQGHVIGKGNKLPWNIPEELALFRRLTSNATVVMGRKTYESIGRPMPHRNNIVVSRSVGAIPGTDVCGTIDEGLERARSYGKDIFIIGGAQIYKQTIPLADKMYLSFITQEYDGDTRFPEFDEAEWRISRREDHGSFEFAEYVRKR